MRIGIDISKLSANLDGIGIYVYDLLYYFDLFNTEDIYYLYSDRPLKVQLKLSNKFIVHIDNGSNHLLWVLTVLPKYLKRDRIEVFWQPNHIFPRKIKNTKNVITICDLSAYSFSQYGSWKTTITHKLFLKMSCKNASAITAISQATKDDVVANIHIEPEKVSVIYVGDTPFKEGYIFDEIEVQKMKNKFGIENDNYMIFVGTINPRKNVEVIIKAYDIFRNRYEIATKLILVGALGWRYQTVLKLIDKSPYKEDIILTGYVSEDEKKHLYYNANELVFPSRLEGFGFPILEAMAAEIPVITSNNSSLPEVGGEAAFYLNNIDDENELAELIYKVETLTEEEKCCVIQKGKERASMFNRKDTAVQTYNLFKEAYGR